MEAMAANPGPEPSKVSERLEWFRFLFLGDGQQMMVECDEPDLVPDVVVY